MATSDTILRWTPPRTGYRPALVETVIRQAREDRLVEVGARGRGTPVQWRSEALWIVGLLLTLQEIGEKIAQASTLVPEFNGLAGTQARFSGYADNIETVDHQTIPASLGHTTFGSTMAHLVTWCGSPDFQQSMKHDRWEIEIGRDWSPFARISHLSVETGRRNLVEYRPVGAINGQPDSTSLRRKSVTVPLELVFTLGDLWAHTEAQLAAKSPVNPDEAVIPGGDLRGRAVKGTEGIPAPPVPSTGRQRKHKPKPTRPQNEILAGPDSTRRVGVRASASSGGQISQAGQIVRTAEDADRPKRPRRRAA